MRLATWGAFTTPDLNRKGKEGFPELAGAVAVRGLGWDWRCSLRDQRAAGGVSGEAVPSTCSPSTFSQLVSASGGLGPGDVLHTGSITGRRQAWRAREKRRLAA